MKRTSILYAITLLSAFTCHSIYYAAEAESKKTELTNILKDILLIQRACQHNDSQHLVSRRFRGTSVSELQRQQRSLISKMKELGAAFTVEEFKAMDQAAHSLVRLEDSVSFETDMRLISHGCLK